MTNWKLLFITILSVAGLMGVILFFFSKDVEPTTEYDLPLVLGASSQKTAVNLTVFSDFQCPACANVEIILNQAREKFADQINYQFRHFPLSSIHPYAMPAALASEAAREQGKFWEYHDLLFTQQQEWTVVKDEAELQKQLLIYAGELELDIEKFKIDLEKEAVLNRVLTDVSDANKLGLNSTPSIFINNKKTAPQDLISNLERSL